MYYFFPMQHRKPLQLEAFLPYRLSLLSNAISGAIAAVYGDKFAISMTEWRILMILAEYRDVDDKDRRRSILRLSETGLSVYDEVMPFARDYETKLLSGLSAGELELFNDMIDRLIEPAGRPGTGPETRCLRAGKS